jgi:RNA polymerase sigma-70 factor, ECF subfamily
MEQLLANVAPIVQRFGMRMCRNAHDADDALQDTLLAIATHLAEFEGRSSLTSWVFALTRTSCARRRRGLKNQPPAEDERAEHRADGRPSPEERAASNELTIALNRALGDLSDEHREVIMARDIEGLTAPEAAEALGITVDALKSRLHRARAALRLALKPLLEPSTASPPSGCPDVVALWSTKLEGDLRASDCAAMEKHLQTCTVCSAACDALKRALFACRSSATAEVGPEIQARVKAAARAWAERAQGM